MCKNSRIIHICPQIILTKTAKKTNILKIKKSGKNI